MLYVFQGFGFGSSRFSSIPRTIKHCIGGPLSLILATLAHFALSHLALKALAFAWICRYLELESWLYWFAMTSGLITNDTTLQTYSDPSRLKPSALRIYADLKAAAEQYDPKG